MAIYYKTIMCNVCDKIYNYDVLMLTKLCG